MMKRECHIEHGVIGQWSLVIALLVLCLAMQSPCAAADDPQVPFIDQTLQRSDEFYAAGMKTLVDDVAKVTELKDEARIAELRKAADAAVRDKMAKSKEGLWKTWRELSHDGEVDQTQFWTAYRKLPEAILTPDRSPLWTDAVKKVLAPEEFAKWSAEETKRRARIEKAITDYLNRGRDTWSSGRTEVRKAHAEELITELKLDASGAQRLRDGVAGAIAASMPSWGKGLEKNIREYVKSAFLGGAEDRITMLEGGQINFGSSAEPDALAAEDVAWKALVKDVLTTDAFAQFEAREQQRLERRVRGLAMMAVAEVDRALRLTDSQRSRLEILFTRVIREGKPKIDAMLSQNYANSSILLMVCNGVKEPELKELLEADQIASWRDLAANYSGWWTQF